MGVELAGDGSQDGIEGLDVRPIVMGLNVISEMQPLGLSNGFGRRLQPDGRRHGRAKVADVMDGCKDYFRLR